MKHLLLLPLLLGALNPASSGSGGTWNLYVNSDVDIGHPWVIVDGGSVTVNGAVSISGTPTVDIQHTWVNIDGGVVVSNFPASQAVTGAFWQSTQPVSLATAPTTPVTGTFWQSTQPVSGTFWQATQPVSGTLTCNVGTGTQPVSGTVTADIQHTWVNVDGGVVVSNFPASQAVTGTFWQATQPVSIASMPSTPVTGTFWQATQPISGTVTANAGTGTLAVSAASLPLPTGAATSAKQPALGTAGTAATDVITVQGIASGVAQPVSGTFWQATQPVSGTFWQATQPVSLATAPTTPVTGTFWQATQPVSGTVTANAGTGTMTVSKDITTGRTIVMKTGTLASSAVTADQVVLTYTVTTGKTFYLEYFACNARLTTFAATATLFGDASLETPSGTKVLTTMLAGSGIGDRDYLPFAEPLPIAAGVVIRAVTTPAATTAMTWRCNIGGYEK